MTELMEKVVDLLIKEGYLKGREPLPHYAGKWNHGPCCTCQTCHFDYDYCVCSHNYLLKELLDLEG
jgi:hypothetical protein